MCTEFKLICKNTRKKLYRLFCNSFFFFGGGKLVIIITKVNMGKIAQKNCHLISVIVNLNISKV